MIVMRMRQDDPLHVARVLAEFGQPSHNALRRAAQTGIHQRH